MRLLLDTHVLIWIVEGRRRAVIEAVEPQLDCGRFPLKRIVGDEIVVRAEGVGRDRGDARGHRARSWR